METAEQAYERGQLDAFRLIAEALRLSWRSEYLADRVLRLMPVAYRHPKVEQKEREG